MAVGRFLCGWMQECVCVVGGTRENFRSVDEHSWLFGRREVWRRCQWWLQHVMGNGCRGIHVGASVERRRIGALWLGPAVDGYSF